MTGTRDSHKRIIGCFAVALACVVAIPAGAADFWPGQGYQLARRGDGGRGDDYRQGGRQSRDDGRQQNYQRGQRDDDRGAQRGQRMSPEERRQLRRDVRDAGREIYPSYR